MTAGTRMNCLLQSVFAISGCLLNAVLLVLILRDRVVTVSYRRILLQSCCVDFLHLFFTFFTQTTAFVVDGHAIAVLNGPTRFFTPALAFGFFAAWIFTVMLSVTSIAVMTFCRYRILTTERFPLWNHIFCFSFALLAGGYNAAMIIVQYMCVDQTLALPPTEAEGETLRYFVLDIRPFASLPSILLSSTFFVVAVSYGIVIVTNLRVFRFVQQNSSVISQRSRDLQSQLNRTLIAQALVPLASTVLPVLMASGAFWCRCHLEAVMQFAILPLILIPLGNAVSVLFFIRAYRRVLFGWLRVKRVQDWLGSIWSTEGALSVAWARRGSHVEDGSAFKQP